MAINNLQPTHKQFSWIISLFRISGVICRTLDETLALHLLAVSKKLYYKLICYKIYIINHMICLIETERRLLG